MGTVTIIDNAGDGRLHIVALEGAAAFYLRDTDVYSPEPVKPPEWLREAGKVKSWADGKGGKRAADVRAAVRAAGLIDETRPADWGIYGLAIYPANHAARRVTLAALAGARDTLYS
jgi:hypothetical protein